MVISTLYPALTSEAEAQLCSECVCETRRKVEGALRAETPLVHSREEILCDLNVIATHPLSFCIEMHAYLQLPSTLLFRYYSNLQYTGITHVAW